MPSDPPSGDTDVAVRPFAIVTLVERTTTLPMPDGPTVKSNNVVTWAGTAPIDVTAVTPPIRRDPVPVTPVTTPFAHVELKLNHASDPPPPCAA